ncbi:MAG: hypothetical protein QOF37_2605, partial [Thermoleophilaceae bacterium]|nr:hypothetical protein [Thermoleophilaceae bacterium]
IAAAVAVAWLGATLGGTAGWLAGLKAGRTVLSRPGPLYRMRMSALERGDRFFERYGAVAVFFSPAWIAGIHGMSAARFLPANALAALTWALAFGLGAYVIGPSILDLVTDLGFVSALVVGALIVAAVVGALRVRRRRRSA